MLACHDVLLLHRFAGQVWHILEGPTIIGGRQCSGLIVQQGSVSCSNKSQSDFKTKNCGLRRWSKQLTNIPLNLDWLGL